MLHMEVSVTAQALVSGAPISVRVAIRNDGQQPADLTALGVPARLEFLLRDATGRVVTMFQGDGTARSFAALKPGGEVRLDLDVQKRTPAPIGPGR